jgi:hemoglobin
MNRRKTLASLSVVTFALAAGLGLSMAAAPVTAANLSLYDRLGGQEAIHAVVDEFVANVAADERINRFFASTDIARLKRLLAEQICAGAGGPCTYSGRDMKSTHAAMGVDGSHFEALVRPGRAQALPEACFPVEGNALDGGSYEAGLQGADTLVHLVGVAHPSPTKAAQFLEVDLASVRAACAAAQHRGISHFVYLSVAQPAPVMRA